MENEVLTSTEPTIVESSAENTAVAAENATVINNATPMDSNVTYNSLPKTEYQPNMSPIQNMVNEAVQIEHSINQESNAGKAMNQFLTQGYDYDKNEAGSYWVAGAINDNNTQMNFLQTIINEEMYDELDLQKYYYDTNLATARAYAAQKKKEVAYGFYQAAQERAYAEGELTGWYMPAEGRYLLGQYTVAQNTLEDPDATAEDKAKATRISKTAEEWFAANQITTRGIKCLAMMNYEENVRHNTVMGELQKQANAIAGSSAAANAAMAELNLKVRKFQLEEEELQRGLELTKALGLDDKDYIGHHPDDYKGLDALRGYGSIENMLAVDTESYSSVAGYKGVDWVNNLLREAGIDPTERYLEYSNDQQLAQFNTDISNSNSIKQESFTKIGKTDSEGHELVYAVIGNEAIVGYFDKNSWVAITDENAKFSDNKSIKTFIENRFGKGTFNTEGINAVTINGETYTFGRSNTQNDKNSYTNLIETGYSKNIINNDGGPYNEEGVKKINAIITASQSEEGITTKDGEKVRNLKYKAGYVDKKHINEFVILEGEEGEYYAPEQKLNGEWEIKKLDKHNLEEIKKVSDTYELGDTWDDSGGFFSDSDKALIAKSSWYMGTDKETNIHYMYVPHGDDYEIVGVYYNNNLSASAQESFGENFSAGTGWYKIVSINPSEDTLNKAGIQLPKEKTSKTAEASYNSREMKYNVYDDKTETSEVETTTTTNSSSSSVSTSKGYTPATSEKKNAVFKKYNVDPIEQYKYENISSIEELEEKIKENQNSILGMGGDQIGK